MKPVELPALDGRDPLGFLAALGLLRLLDAEAPGRVRLSFADDTAHAVLHSGCATLDEVADALVRIVARAAPESVIVGSDPRFPLRAATRKDRSAGADGDGKVDESDPMRVPRDRYRDLVARVAAVDADAPAAWMPFLVTDLAMDTKGRSALSLFCAPSGKQNLRTFYRTPLDAVRAEPFRLREALTGWRRVDHFTGEYLDHRVIRDAADTPSGKSVEAGVPGATWLATMALPLLRTTGDGERVATALWHRVQRRYLMVWPLWDHPLDIHAVRVLLEHPALRPRFTPTGPVLEADLSPLGVITVCAAERQPLEGRKSAGVLAPTTLRTAPPPPR